MEAMRSGPEGTRESLAWVTRAFAVNPAHVVAVFHGRNGEVEIHLTAGNTHRFREAELTAVGRALLLPPVEPPADAGALAAPDPAGAPAT